MTELMNDIFEEKVFYYYNQVFRRLHSSRKKTSETKNLTLTLTVILYVYVICICYMHMLYVHVICICYT